MNALAKKVLVVDDDPVIGRSFNRVLSEKGYVVITASDGQEALDKIAREEYDLVFTDIRMPGLDGLAVAGRIKQRRPWLPVVIVTGYGTSANEAQAHAAGVSGFLRKPLSPEMIEESTLAALLEKEARPAPHAQVETPAQALAGAAPETDSRANGVAHFPKNVALFFAAPFVGLAYILAFPFVGIGMLAWTGVRALEKRSINIVPVVRNLGLFLAAPFLGLAYLLAFPFIGLAMLVWLGARAMMKGPPRK